MTWCVLFKSIIGLLPVFSILIALDYINIVPNDGAGEFLKMQKPKVNSIKQHQLTEKCSTLNRILTLHRHSCSSCRATVSPRRSESR